MFSSKRLHDCDLTRSPAVFFLAIIFLLSRAPFINLGFTAFISPTDQDVLAVVNSAYLLRYYDVYTVSRFPGYPFFEIFNSLLIGGGWIFTNTATAVVSFISVVLFGNILNIFEIKNKALLVLTFAFLPVIWINSTITMDYMWALMFILLACFLLFKGNYCLAGIAIGFAVGTRFTSLFMLIPLIYWMVMKKADSKNIKEFILTGFLTSLALFSPVIYKYNLGFFHGSGFLYTTPVRQSVEYVINSLLLSSVNLIEELTGVLAFVLIVVLMLFYKNATEQHEHLLNFCWIALILYVVIYFIFPYKVAYLIPVVPWSLIILSERLHKKHVAIICVLLVLNNIVSINVNENSFKAGMDSGIVLKNYHERKQTGIIQSEEYLKSLAAVLNNARLHDS